MESKLLVHVLVCVFAVSSWVDINGMWVELPILVSHLPEQWTLPSYITVLGQVANIGPLVFLAITYRISGRPVKRPTLDKITSYIIMLVGLTSTLLLSFFWRSTQHVAGAERSLALLTLSFFLSLMDCTSSVAYVAFMASLQPVYLSSFFVGEGLSGLLPALMALGQGVGEIKCVNASSTSERNVSGNVVNVTDYYVYPTYLPPRFSVQLFFLLLCGMIFLSMVAFSLLNFWGYCKDQFTNSRSFEDYNQVICPSDQSANDFESGDTTDTVQSPLLSSTPSLKCGSDGPKNDDALLQLSSGYSYPPPVSVKDGIDECTPLFGDKTKAPTREISLLLVQVVVINFFITSFLLSIQVYSSLPYGISIYNLVVTLTNIANPLACAVAIFLPVTSCVGISVLTGLGLVCTVYVVLCASLSPAPPLVASTAGGPVIVLLWIAVSFFLTYAKISVAGVMRHVGRRALIWYGSATQVGSLIGALTGFVLVNQVKVFNDASWC
ncbi:solute carrier family 52, riboflavin transporter, member 3-B-like isoform X2 [Pomacea canaliculata]|uniref:solute carrier family 52, riboflavin transporter, member 3-B-like isoform X2 n=1 Tax=Pomacea canaliculata TaxID=400727 RepID=UPI000D726C30|nr:solute carrier family 52, riboflavin transporter, member 3-B-like isoform X2 [Pomacea canaliculata]